MIATRTVVSANCPYCGAHIADVEVVGDVESVTVSREMCPRGSCRAKVRTTQRI